jgi:hypothetical protein
METELGSLKFVALVAGAKQGNLAHQPDANCGENPPLCFAVRQATEGIVLGDPGGSSYLMKDGRRRNKHNLDISNNAIVGEK